jgi:sugar lactone lactonase YvrE
MQFTRTKSFIIAAILSLHAAALAGDAYKWSVQYLIDNSQGTFGRSMKVYPRNNRGLAISADGKYLYVGYMHSFDGRGEVRKIAIDVADYERAVSAVLPGPLGKAIAVDDKNRVYITNQNDVLIYDADLERRLFRVNAGECDGVCVVREGGVLVLYTTERNDAVLQRYVLTEKGSEITEAKLGGFDGTGVFHIPGCQDPRNVRADAKGNLWVADLKGNKVFRIRKDAKDLKSVEVNSPMDIAFDKGRTFVTRWEERSITVLDDEMLVLGNLNVPWEELELSPFGNNRYGALSGIVVVPGKGFFVANEDGQTANQKSTYGKVDNFSGLLDGKLYKDLKNDDNDPILRATVVSTGP